MTRFFKETKHGSITANIKSKPEEGGIAIDAQLEGEFIPTTDTWLEDVRVLPEGQGNGEGDLLIESLEQAAREAGCRRIIGCFEPWTNLTAAAKFYMKHKYKLKKSKRNPDYSYIYKDLS